MNHLKLSTLAIAVICSVGLSHAESGANTTAPNSEYSLNAKDKSQLFTLDQGDNDKTDVRAAYLKNDPRAEHAWIIHINTNLISADTQKITLPLQDGNTISFYLSDFSKDKNNISVWNGSYLPKADKERYGEHGTVALENNAIFVKNGQNITGSFVVDGEQYNIDPLGNGEHALVKVDSTFPVEDDDMPALARTPFNFPETFTTTTAHSKIRVLVVTTNIARQNVIDMDGLVAHMFAEANETNENSHVNITFEHAGTFHADYQDTGIPEDSLRTAHNPETPLGAQVAKARDQRKADLVVILGSNINNTSNCGVGALNATKEDAFSALSYTCTRRSTYTFQHELGHNFGLKHNWGGADANPDIIVPEYAYGFSVPGRFRTVMSYPMAGEKKINYWSNPAISYNGTSQMIGDDHANAARLLNERREYVANFYPPMGDEIMQAPVITLDRPEITAVKSGNQYTNYVVTATGDQEGLGWQWERVDGDENITLESGKSNKALVVVPKGLTGVTAKFRARGTNMDKQTGEAIVTVNVVDPAVEISGPASIDTAAPVKLEAKANFNEPTYKWELRKGEQVIAEGIDRNGQIKAGLEAGDYTVVVTASSAHGARSATATHTLTITSQVQNNDQAFIDGLK